MNKSGEPIQTRVDDPEIALALARVHEAALRSFRAENRRVFFFCLLNETASVRRYDRAALWRIADGKPDLLGVSAQADVDRIRKTEMASCWSALVSKVSTLSGVRILSRNDFSDHPAWRRLEEFTPGLSVVWMPIQFGGKPMAGLWLERWEGKTWNVQDQKILAVLSEFYGLIWENRVPPSLKEQFKRLSSRRWFWITVFLFAALFFWRLPLRVAAPCEIIPKDPVVIAAPLEEVIDHIQASPNQEVKAGDILFVYRKEIALKELEAGRKRVQVSQSRYDRAEIQAIGDPVAMSAALAESLAFKNALEQEKKRLELAEYRVSKLEVRAPVDGVAVIEHPQEWAGKPVRVGERVLLIVKPSQSRLRILIPEQDHVSLDLKKPVSVCLEARPGPEFEANLAYMGQWVENDPRWGPCFVAEADWKEPLTGGGIGLKGTAFLYGEEVSLFYWLLRKPLAAIQKLVGF